MPAPSRHSSSRYTQQLAANVQYSTPPRNSPRPVVADHARPLDQSSDSITDGSPSAAHSRFSRFNSTNLPSSNLGIHRSRGSLSPSPSPDAGPPAEFRANQPDWAKDIQKLKDENEALRSDIQTSKKAQSSEFRQFEDEVVRTLRAQIQLEEAERTALRDAEHSEIVATLEASNATRDEAVQRMDQIEARMSAMCKALNAEAHSDDMLVCMYTQAEKFQTLCSSHEASIAQTQAELRAQQKSSGEAEQAHAAVVMALGEKVSASEALTRREEVEHQTAMRQLEEEHQTTIRQLAVKHCERIDLMEAEVKEKEAAMEAELQRCLQVTDANKELQAMQIEMKKVVESSEEQVANAKAAHAKTQAKLNELYELSSTSELALIGEREDLTIKNEALMSEKEALIEALTTQERALQQSKAVAISKEAALVEFATEKLDLQDVVVSMQSRRDEVDAELTAVKSRVAVQAGELSASAAQASQVPSLTASVAELVEERDALKAKLEAQVSTVSSWQLTVAQLEVSKEELTKMADAKQLLQSQLSKLSSDWKLSRVSMSALEAELEESTTSLKEMAAERHCLEHQAVAREEAFQQQVNWTEERDQQLTEQAAERQQLERELDALGEENKSRAKLLQAKEEALAGNSSKLELELRTKEEQLLKSAQQVVIKEKLLKAAEDANALAKGEIEELRLDKDKIAREAAEKEEALVNYVRDIVEKDEALARGIEENKVLLGQMTTMHELEHSLQLQTDRADKQEQALSEMAVEKLSLQQEVLTKDESLKKYSEQDQVAQRMTKQRASFELQVAEQRALLERRVSDTAALLAGQLRAQTKLVEQRAAEAEEVNHALEEQKCISLVLRNEAAGKDLILNELEEQLGTQEQRLASMKVEHDEMEQALASKRQAVEQLEYALVAKKSDLHARDTLLEDAKGIEAQLEQTVEGLQMQLDEKKQLLIQAEADSGKLWKQAAVTEDMMQAQNDDTKRLQEEMAAMAEQSAKERSSKLILVQKLTEQVQLQKDLVQKHEADAKKLNKENEVSKDSILQYSNSKVETDETIQTLTQIREDQLTQLSEMAASKLVLDQKCRMLEIDCGSQIKKLTTELLSKNVFLERQAAEIEGKELALTKARDASERLEEENKLLTVHTEEARAQVAAVLEKEESMQGTVAAAHKTQAAAQARVTEGETCIQELEAELSQAEASLREQSRELSVDQACSQQRQQKLDEMALKMQDLCGTLDRTAAELQVAISRKNVLEAEGFEMKSKLDQLQASAESQQQQLTDAEGAITKLEDHSQSQEAELRQLRGPGGAGPIASISPKKPTDAATERQRRRQTEMDRVRKEMENKF